MFTRKRKQPTKPFIHAEDCQIFKADPSVQIPWNYEGDGFWKAECVCTYETYVEPIVDDRVRLDPLDPKTSRHLGQCEYVSATDPAVLKVLLKVKPGSGRGLRLGRVRFVRRRLAGSALRRKHRVTTNPLLRRAAPPPGSADLQRTAPLPRPRGGLAWVGAESKIRIKS